jgi:hypothetical protein
MEHFDFRPVSIAATHRCKLFEKILIHNQVATPSVGKRAVVLAFSRATLYVSP